MAKIKIEYGFEDLINKVSMTGKKETTIEGEYFDIVFTNAAMERLIEVYQSLLQL